MPRVPTHTDVEFFRFAHLPGVELRRSRYQECVFRAHTHPVWSVAIIESGSTMSAHSGGYHRAEAGQIVVVPPGHVHACNPTDGDPISYLMFYLSCEWFAPTQPAGVYPVFPSPIIDDPPLFERWRALFGELIADLDTADRAPLQAAVASLVAAHAKPDTKQLSAEESSAVATAKRVLRERLAQRVTLKELAAETNMSRSHLSRAFTAAEGLPPHTYHNQLRVDRARELLAAGAPLAEAGLATGFTDQSHFSRVFRQYTGATPSQYQAANATAAD